MPPKLKLVSKQKAAPQPEVPAAPAPFAVPLSLSESDRWFAAAALFKTAWSGGESVVLALNAIHETLRVASVPIDELPAQLSRTARTYTLMSDQTEMLLKLLCGGGGVSFNGQAGPMLAKLVQRIRGQIEKARPKKEGTK